MIKNELKVDVKIIDKNVKEIEYLYKKKNYQIKEIANKFNVVPHRLSSFIRKKEWIRDFNNKNVVKELHYNQKLKIYEMAELLNCSVDSISRSFKRFNLEVLNEVRYGSMSRYSFKENFFEEINTERKAYWLGFILADGCITYTHSKAKKTYNQKRYDRLTITLSYKDKNHLEKFANDIEYNGVIETGESFTFGKNHKYSRLRITSEKLCNDLMDKNIHPNKSGREKPYLLDDNLVNHYLRGYFDGDGYYSDYNQKNRSYRGIEFGFMGSYDIVSYFRDELIKNEIKTNANIGKLNEGIYIFKTGGFEVFQDFYNYLYENSNVYLDRKYKVISNFINHKERYSPSFIEK